MERIQVGQPENMEFNNPYRSLSEVYICNECSYEDNIDGWNHDNINNELICPHCNSRIQF